MRVFERLVSVTIALSLVSCNAPTAIELIGTSPSDDPPVVIEDTEITASPSTTTFIYRADSAADKIYFGSLDLTTGTLSEHPAIDLDPGSRPSSLALSTDNQYLFVANKGTNKIDTYQINSTTGALTLVKTRGPYHSMETIAGKLYVDPQNRLWSAEKDDDDFVHFVTYTINWNGELIDRWEMYAGGGTDEIRQIISDSAGDYLYVNYEHDSIWVFEIDVSGPALVSGSNGGVSPNSMVINAATGRLYTAPSDFGDRIESFLIDPSTGDISSETWMDGEQITTFKDIAVNAAGDRLYLLSETAPTAVKSFVLDTSGVPFLDTLNTVSLPSGCKPKLFASLMEDDYLITACTDGSGETFSLKIEADGSLTQKNFSKRTGMVVNSMVAVTF